MKSVKTPPALNRDWHAANPMPSKATFEQRVAWHREHSKHCHCRQMPVNIRRAIEEEDRRPQRKF